MERHTFTREFKVEAVKLIRVCGVTVAQASRDLGVHGTVLRRWIQECAADAQQAFPGQGQMKPEQAELARRARRTARETRPKRTCSIISSASIIPSGGTRRWAI